MPFAMLTLRINCVTGDPCSRRTQLLPGWKWVFFFFLLFLLTCSLTEMLCYWASEPLLTHFLGPRLLLFMILPPPQPTNTAAFVSSLSLNLMFRLGFFFCVTLNLHVSQNTFDRHRFSDVPPPTPVGSSLVLPLRYELIRLLGHVLVARG